MSTTATSAWTPDGTPLGGLWAALGRPASVTAVGAGGKTTLVHALAREAAASGASVLLTTTTKMSLEDGLVTDPDAALASRAPGRVVVAGVPGDVKFTSFPDADLDRLAAGFDVVVVEGDGSRRRPLKVPSGHEPVLPAWTEVALVVAGLSAIGGTIGEVCYRVELASGLLGWDVAAEALDAPTFATLVRLGYLENPRLAGVRRVVALHQADDSAAVAAGRAVASGLPGVQVLLTTTAPGERNRR